MRGQFIPVCHTPCVLGRGVLHDSAYLYVVIIAIKSILGFFLGDALIMLVDWKFLIVFTTLTIMGMFLGIYIGKFINGNKLKKGFGYFVLLMAVFVLITEFFI